MADSAHGEDPDLRQYVDLLLRRKWLIAIIAVLAVASSIVYSFSQPKVYEAQAQVILRGGAASVATPQTGVVTPIEQTVDAERKIMAGNQMRLAIMKRVGYLPVVNVVTADKSPTISIFHRGETPRDAAKGASDFATAFVAERSETITRDLVRSIRDGQKSLKNLDAQTAASQERIDQVQVELRTATQRNQRLQLQSELERLRFETSPAAVADRASKMQANLDQLQGALSTNMTRGSFTVARAAAPEAPILPKPRLNALIALLSGLLIGVGVAFARDYFDDTIRTKEDVTRLAGDLPVLGIIPVVKPWKDKKEAVLESIVRPGSVPAEAYRGLRTALEFTGVGRDMRVIHVTSSEPGEGKSTTAANLAVALARSGHDVILVDCDLRRPRAHQFFGIDNSVGFTTLLLGTTTVEASLHRIPEVPGLFVLPSGPLPPNPSELLDNAVTHSRFQLLAKSADYVIVDSPPLLPVADSVVIAGQTHATLLVVRARVARRRSVARSLELLAQVNVPPTGIVLNGVGDEGTYGYSYGYYQQDDPRFDPRLWRRSREVIHSGQHDLSSIANNGDKTSVSREQADITEN